MQVVNIDMEQSEAVIGWNQRGLAGYAVHKGNVWACVACAPPGPVTHVFRRGDAALRWLHDAGAASSFESLADSSDLNHLIGPDTRGLLRGPGPMDPATLV
jgi:hypothetical protein